MAADTEEGLPDGKAVDYYEERLKGDDAVDEAGEQLLGWNGVFFDELREVVEPRC